VNVFEAIDLGAFPRRADAGKSAEPSTRAEPRSNEEDPETARERILEEHYGPRTRGIGPHDFDRAAYNAEAERQDREYAALRTAERSAADRATAQDVLDSLRSNSRGSSNATAYKRFQR
jgi:hypothetical protein